MADETRRRAKPRGQRHHGDLREALLAETLAEIERVGPHAVHLRDVARRLRVSEAAPYHHFAGRDDILGTLAARGYRALHERVLAALANAGDDPFERLAAIGRAYVAHALAHPGYFRVMFGSQMIALAEHGGARVAGSAVRGVLDETAARCARELGDPAAAEGIARTAWATAHGVAWLVLEQEVRFTSEEGGPDAAVEAFTEMALAVLIEGLRRRPRPR